MRRVALILAIGMAVVAAAKWAAPVSAPLSRLLANAEAKVKAEPKDAKAHYLLGRIRSLAYASATKEIQVYDPDNEVRFPPFEGIQNPYARVGKTLDPTAKAHLISSVGHYAKAVEYAPGESLYWLGYGWMLEQGARWVKVLPKQATGWPKAMATAAWNEAASGAYRKAFDLAKKGDAEAEHRWGHANGVVSIDAIDSLRRLSGAGKVRLASGFLAEMRKHEALIAKKPMAMTPIVFPLSASTPYSAIDNPRAKVKFDLEGGGTARRWSWITPRAAFLVWHPLADGHVDSGRELFGNATFWMFFRNGYEALGALDDDRNGELAGRELRFIAAWRDVNSNGVSEPGEVKPVGEYGITAIRCRPEGKRGGIWFRRTGLVRRDGSTLPTYDWVGRRR